MRTGPGERRRRGDEAEALAARHLEARGYEILARNHLTRRGEVDLVCRDGEAIVFVEVRSRSAGTIGDVLETVDRAKARRVVAAAADWAARHEVLDAPLRFDVVAILLDGATPIIEVVRDAFDAQGRPTP